MKRVLNTHFVHLSYLFRLIICLLSAESKSRQEASGVLQKAGATERRRQRLQRVFFHLKYCIIKYVQIILLFSYSFHGLEFL